MFINLLSGFIISCFVNEEPHPRDEPVEGRNLGCGECAKCAAGAPSALEEPRTKLLTPEHQRRKCQGLLLPQEHGARPVVVPAPDARGAEPRLVVVAIEADEDHAPPRPVAVLPVVVDGRHVGERPLRPVAGAERLRVLGVDGHDLESRDGLVVDVVARPLRVIALVGVELDLDPLAGTRTPLRAVVVEHVTDVVGVVLELVPDPVVLLATDDPLPVVPEGLGERAERLVERHGDLGVVLVEARRLGAADPLELVGVVARGTHPLVGRRLDVVHGVVEAVDEAEGLVGAHGGEHLVEHRGVLDEPEHLLRGEVGAAEQAIELIPIALTKGCKTCHVASLLSKPSANINPTPCEINVSLLFNTAPYSQKLQLHGAILRHLSYIDYTK